MKILYPLAKRFIAGHDFDSAKPKIQKLMDEGFEVSVDYLGELSTNARDCRAATRQYIEIIKYYSIRKLYDKFFGKFETKNSHLYAQ